MNISADVCPIWTECLIVVLMFQALDVDSQKN